MGLLTDAVLLETRAGPCDEACYQDHRGCYEILSAFALVKSHVYTQISEVNFIIFFFFGCNSGEDAWVCLSVRSDCCLGDDTCFQLRRENVLHQEDLIVNHEELFCVNGCLGQKAAGGFLILAAFLPGNLVLCHPVLRGVGEPCCWARTCLDSVCAGVCMSLQLLHHILRVGISPTT